MTWGLPAAPDRGAGRLRRVFGRRARTAPSRRTLWWRGMCRRVAAALLVGVAAWLAYSSLVPDTPAADALVAASDLPAGHRLTAADVTVRRTDPGLLPKTAVTEAATVVGQRLGSSLGAGEVVTTGRLRPAESLRNLPTDQRALHVPLTDPGTLGLVRGGDRVDVVDSTSGRVVGPDVLVLSVDAPAEAGGGLAAQGASTAGGVVLAVTTAELAPIVSAASGSGAGVHLALRPDPTAG